MIAFESKDYKSKQAEFFKGLKSAYGESFDTYFVEYIKWKIAKISEGYQGITVDEESSVAKAKIAHINGKVQVLKDVLSRMS